MLKDHNAVTPVRLEPAALGSRVEHSTTEPLRSHSSKGAASTIFTPLVWCRHGIRTHDLPLQKRTLYQLSYRGVKTYLLMRWQGPDALAVVRSNGVYLLDFFCSGIQFYLLLSHYLCFISFLYLDLYVLGVDALIS